MSDYPDCPECSTEVEPLIEYEHGNKWIAAYACENCETAWDGDDWFQATGDSLQTI
jgi:hypothetical protein